MPAEALQKVEKALEFDQGHLNLQSIESERIWDEFCLVMAYSKPSVDFEFQIENSDILSEYFTDLNEDSFGVGVFFVVQGNAVSYFQMPAIKTSTKDDFGSHINSISRKISDDLLYIPPLNPRNTNDSHEPQRTCYERDYTIKIWPDWTYTISKVEGM